MTRTREASSHTARDMKLEEITRESVNACLCGYQQTGGRYCVARNSRLSATCDCTCKTAETRIYLNMLSKHYFVLKVD